MLQIKNLNFIKAENTINKKSIECNEILLIPSVYDEILIVISFYKSKVAK